MEVADFQYTHEVALLLSAAMQTIYTAYLLESYLLTTNEQPRCPSIMHALRLTSDPNTLRITSSSISQIARPDPVMPHPARSWRSALPGGRPPDPKGSVRVPALPGQRPLPARSRPD